MIVPSHGHIWCTIAHAPKLRKHSSEPKSLFGVPRPLLFSQHGINMLIGGFSNVRPPRGNKQQRVGTYLSLGEVEVDGDLVAP